MELHPDAAGPDDQRTLGHAPRASGDPDGRVGPRPADHDGHRHDERLGEQRPAWPHHWVGETDEEQAGRRRHQEAREVVEHAQGDAPSVGVAEAEHHEDRAGEDPVDGARIGQCHDACHHGEDVGQGAQGPQG